MKGLVYEKKASKGGLSKTRRNVMSTETGGLFSKKHQFRAFSGKSQVYIMFYGAYTEDLPEKGACKKVNTDATFPILLDCVVPAGESIASEYSLRHRRLL